MDDIQPQSETRLDELQVHIKTRLVELGYNFDLSFTDESQAEMFLRTILCKGITSITVNQKKISITFDETFDDCYHDS